MKLYTYFRSSAAWRVRIALAWKGLAYEPVFVHLRRGEQTRPEYLARNPQGLVPLLVDGDVEIAQSLAILEYLEEKWPAPPLLPADPAGRARVRQLALVVACEIHPLQNLRVRSFVARDLGLGEAAGLRFSGTWIARGLAELEALVARSPATGRFCHGDAPTFADLLLVPQLYNARGGRMDLSAYPTLVRIDAACRELPAFADTAPEKQPDAE
jgi:maleylpyruvate isomerase